MKRFVSQRLSSFCAVVSILSFVVITPLRAEDAPAKYQSSCFACHSTGAAGAPLTGDTAAWEPRMELGKEALISSVRNGKGAMPPTGLCADCTDDELVELIEYMAGKSF